MPAQSSTALASYGFHRLFFSCRWSELSYIGDKAQPSLLLLDQHVCASLTMSSISTTTLPLHTPNIVKPPLLGFPTSPYGSVGFVSLRPLALHGKTLWLLNSLMAQLMISLLAAASSITVSCLKPSLPKPSGHQSHHRIQNSFRLPHRKMVSLGRISSGLGYNWATTTTPNFFHPDGTPCTSLYFRRTYLYPSVDF
jgi:hypothetical protein